MTGYLQRQIAEIRSSPVLQMYGFFLALVHALTFLFLSRMNGGALFGNPADALCWPYLPDCGHLGLSPALFERLLWGYGALIVAAFIAMSLRRWTLAYFFSAALLAGKFALLSLSYRFMGNYHYMPQVIQLLWLFAPNKSESIRLMLVAFYFAAGTIKLNMEWLSGAALLREPFLRGPLLSLSLFYVPLLEMVLVLGLLARRRWLQLAALLQLTAFHLFSWHIVGYFYPLVMFCLLSIFVMTMLTENEERGLLERLLAGRLNRSSWIALGLFAAFQILPVLLVRDSALSGGPRIAALNMLDAWTDCSAIVQYKDERGHWAQSAPFAPVRGAVRLNCDPLVFLNQARFLCARAPLKEARLVLFSRRSTDRDYKKVLDVPNACEHPRLMWAEVL